MSTASRFAFTICSNNYLGQAIALKQSFLEHNPDMGFYIILVDKLADQVAYSQCEPAVVVPVREISGINLPDLIKRYYIIELNTAVKASCFKHILKENPQAKAIYYLDPDLYFYKSLSETNTLLQTHSAVLTPHILSPIPRDGKLPNENTFMRFGIYNLGFIGLNTTHEHSLEMLNWWEERTLKFGYDLPHKGYFVDQLWMVFVPLFFKDVYVIKTFNYNMAPWNLHERNIVAITDNQVQLNDNTNLVFYHFSKLANNQDAISREYNRYSFQDFPKLKQLYNAYYKVLEACNYKEYKSIPIAYPVRMQNTPAKGKQSFLNRGFKKIGAIFNKIGDKF